MQRITFIILLSFILTHIKAEELILTPQQIESIFLEKNLELIAEKLNISIADAALAEAKVWDNPEITVSNINIWQKGKPKQFSAELSQMFSLSARRAKLADVERIGKVIKQSQFEELLRSLKVELRNAISELYYTQNLLQIINEQKILTSEIVDKCQKQSNKGNISKAEIIRLQTALFELEGEIYEIELQFNSLQKDIKNILSLDPTISIKVTDNLKNYPSPNALNLSELISKTINERNDIHIVELHNEYYKKDIRYQKSLSVPDLNIGVEYDRYGGVWENFVGIGMGIQIPIFNRNKGAIKTAQIQLKQNELILQQSKIVAANEVSESYQNYLITYSLLEKSKLNPGFQELDNMIKIYADNLLKKNISVLEYMDFMNSYRSGKQLILNSEKELNRSFEQLQYYVGQEIK